MTDELTQPAYYQHPILGDATDYVKHMPYFQGAVFKYVLRAGNKPGVPAKHDLKKALECLRIIKEKDIPTVILRGELADRTHEYFQSINAREAAENVFLATAFWRAKSLRGIVSGFIDELLENDIEQMLRTYKQLLEQDEETK